MILSNVVLQILPGPLRSIAGSAFARIHSESRRTGSAKPGTKYSSSRTAISGSCFTSSAVVPESASWIYLIAPIIAFTAMMIVPILIPVLTDRPLPLSDMGDMLGGGMILTLGSFAIILAGLDTRKRVWRHWLKQSRDVGHPR